MGLTPLGIGPKREEREMVDKLSCFPSLKWMILEDILFTSWQVLMDLNPVFHIATMIVALLTPSLLLPAVTSQMRLCL